MAEPSGPSWYLCEADQIRIADRLRQKATISAITVELSRSPSTISREIRGALAWGPLAVLTPVGLTGLAIAVPLLRRRGLAP
ncbi:helix-turn-helix domain-containing protein [Kitasatospora sp. NPDC002227]|uniref:helix-turn-helix domain-containing protein n=1 Tax=Kitasatospora sp. NPDC002227 TaxID=3154773 RepID=UPI003332C864